MEAPDSTALLLDRNKAFEMFRRSAKRSETLEVNNETIKQLVVEAKSLGEKANAARSSIGAAATQINRLRMDRAMGSTPHDPAATGGAPVPDSPEVLVLLDQVKEQKRYYEQ